MDVEAEWYWKEIREVSSFVIIESRDEPVRIAEPILMLFHGILK